MLYQKTLQCTGAAFLSYINPNTNISNLTNLPTCYYFYSGETEGEETKLLLQSKTPNYDFGAAAFDFETSSELINKRILNLKVYYTVSGTERTPRLKPSSYEYYSEGVLVYSRPEIPISQLTLNNLGNYDLRGETDLSSQITTNTTSYNGIIDLDNGWIIVESLTEDGIPPRVVICSGNSKYQCYYDLEPSDIEYPMVKEYDADNPGQGGYNRTIAKSSVYLVVEWEYVEPDIPTINSPINASFAINEPITFSWNYNSQIASPQASATIEYKLSSASTWTAVTSSGSGTTYTLSAGLSAGSYQWRVKVTDEQGMTSVYSATKEFSVVAQPVPSPTYPVDTGLPAYAPIAFSWTFNKPSSASAATQAAAKIQYRERGSNLWIDITVSGSSTTYTLQAGLAVGQYEWRVQVTNNYSETSSYCNIKYFQIVAQSAPTPVSPGDNITLFEGHDVTFTWIYNSLTPATQASATIKYRVRGGSTWTTYTSASSNPYCSISDIPQGQYEWCLNITNNYGETSVDSGTLEFNIIGRPQKPIINEPDNCCLTTISWNAEGQEAAEFILMDGDGNVLIHETVATAVTSYKPQMFLKGSYKAMARIKNNSDLWSDYGELEFDIDAAEPDPGTLIAMPFDTEIHLEGTYTSTNVAIVRIDEDGTENVLAMADHAIDKKVAVGIEYAYVLRSWNSGGYVDTPTKIFNFKFEGSILSTDTEELHLDKSTQQFYSHDEDLERQYAEMRYVGREFAVIERGEYTAQTLQKQFHITREQRKILDRMAKEKTIFYRDSRGNAFKAAILSVTYTNYMSDEYIATIKLTRTAADEVIINV